MITFIQMPTVPFDWMVQRPQQIMNELSLKGHKVYYVEQKPGNYKIAKNDNLTVVGKDYNLALENLLRPIVLWCSCPDQCIGIDKIPHDYVIYDVVDDATHEFSGWETHINTMLRKANLVFTSARKLYNEFSVKHRKVYLVNNGVDINNFLISKTKKPKDLPTNKKIVGYVGAVASWIDWNLVNYIVKDYNYNFVFVGPLYNLRKIPVVRSNLYFLGIKDYTELPFYINNFDCCIIPFKVNSMTNSCNPIKLYEYMSLGKPVVSTAMKEVMNFSNVCYTATSDDQFSKLIVRCVNEKNKKLIDERIDIAKNNSWSVRASTILDIIKKELKYKLI